MLFNSLFTRYTFPENSALSLSKYTHTHTHIKDPEVRIGPLPKYVRMSFAEMYIWVECRIEVRIEYVLLLKSVMCVAKHFPENVCHLLIGRPIFMVSHFYLYKPNRAKIIKHTPVRLSVSTFVILANFTQTSIYDNRTMEKHIYFRVKPTS